MRIIFRTDASHQIGTGHVMRCLTLAQALSERGAECRFVCREHSGNLIALIRERGCETEVLPLGEQGAQEGSLPEEAVLNHAHWLGSDWRHDAEATIEALEGSAPEWLIVDHYALDAQWESALRPHVGRIMVIDDLADRQHDCDLLLDQNLVADMAHRYDGKLPEHCGRMLGPEYALLQAQYADLHPRAPPREGPVQRVLIYFGGADTENLTGRAIDAFVSLQHEDLALDVVINPSSFHAAAVREQVRGGANINLYESVPSLAPLMVKADLAIGAGGATSWERCCLGLPTLIITLAENQKPIAAELDRRGLARWLGHQDEVGEARLAQAMEELTASALPPAWSEDCQRVVDGKGTERVSSILLLDAQTPLRARLARVDDEALILDWANDPLVRKNAFVKSDTDPAAHRGWFRKSLRDFENCRLYVVETQAGLPVGHVRFERSDVEWQLQHFPRPFARARNLGRSLVATALQAFRVSAAAILVFDGVKSTNDASRGAFKELGFECETQGESLSLAICSDAGSWINSYVSSLILGWLADGHRVSWAHKATDLPSGDICFYLSYGKIVDASTRARYKHNLVVHASDLPKGRGWSPASWLILEGADQIPVTLLEAVDEVDAGPIYLQEWLELDGTELIDRWRDQLGAATVRLAQAFVASYPRVVSEVRKQSGDATWYPRRRANDSLLDVNTTIAQQFNQFRIADNENYPAYVVYKDKKFLLKVFAFEDPET